MFVLVYVGVHVGMCCETSYMHTHTHIPVYIYKATLVNILIQKQVIIPGGPCLLVHCRSMVGPHTTLSLWYPCVGPHLQALAAHGRADEEDQPGRASSHKPFVD